MSRNDLLQLHSTVTLKTENKYSVTYSITLHILHRIAAQAGTFLRRVKQVSWDLSHERASQVQSSPQIWLHTRTLPKDTQKKQPANVIILTFYMFQNKTEGINNNISFFIYAFL
jgi:hypothetical protein